MNQDLNFVRIRNPSSSIGGALASTIEDLDEGVLTAASSLASMRRNTIKNRSCKNASDDVFLHQRSAQFLPSQEFSKQDYVSALAFGNIPTISTTSRATAASTAASRTAAANTSSTATRTATAITTSSSYYSSPYFASRTLAGTPITRSTDPPQAASAAQAMRTIQSLYYQNLLAAQVKNQYGHFAMLPELPRQNSCHAPYDEQYAAAIMRPHLPTSIPPYSNAADAFTIDHYNHSHGCTGTMARNDDHSVQMEISSQNILNESTRSDFKKQDTPKPFSPGPKNHPTTNNIDLSKTLKIPTLSTNGKEMELRDLLTQQDRALTTRFTFAIIEHFDFVYFDEADRRSHRTHLPVGFRVIGCRHCLVPAGKSGRFFPSSLKTLSDSQKTLYTLHNHLIKCRVTPEDVKYRLDFLRQTHLKERKTLQCHGSQRAFFRRIWNLMCDDSHGSKKLASKRKFEIQENEDQTTSDLPLLSAKA